MLRLLAMCFMLAVAAAAVALGGVDSPEIASNASTQPATPLPSIPSADELLKQLSTPDWKQRQETIHRIVAFGTAVDPLLRDLLSRDLDREARKNIEFITDRIREDRVLGPSMITLHVRNAAPSDVFASISKQCAGTIPTWPDKLWEQGTWAKLTLDYNARPFWEVMQELSRRMELDCVSVEPQEIRVARDSGHAAGATCIAGAFLLTADALTFRNGMNVELSVYGEPKLSVIRAVSFQLDHAEDDHGNPLLPQTSRRALSRRFRTGSRQLPMPFERPPEEVSKIASFRGTMTVAIQTSATTWEVPDPLSMQPCTKLVDSIPVTIESLTPSSDGESYEFQASLPAGWSSKGIQDEMAELVRKRLKFLDADGHPLAVGSADARGLGDVTRITAEVSRTPEDGSPKAGPPAKLIWQVPTRTRSVVVPFDFKNLVINDPFN
jgi:hypothetical protein